ncbi:hypothetical protein DRH14_01835 [Candidatus Shapirobacteria bacterium]|nr:MAG: hypothetical protein DRH14_01835 [Candidatus Shapirobacteria bacterium]
MVKTPELDKLGKAIEVGEGEDKWEIISRFLEWAEENDIYLARWRNGKLEGLTLDDYTGVLYDYFGVDPDELDEERKELLMELTRIENERKKIQDKLDALDYQDLCG